MRVCPSFDKPSPDKLVTVRLPSAGARLATIPSLLLFFEFFFSSRRRHTRCLSDWSSDVCSSDLNQRGSQCDCCNDRCNESSKQTQMGNPAPYHTQLPSNQKLRIRKQIWQVSRPRSEERRVGKDGRDQRQRNDDEKSNVIGEEREN